MISLFPHKHRHIHQESMVSGEELSTPVPLSGRASDTILPVQPVFTRYI